MADLKSKAKAKTKSKSSGSLAKKAKSRPSTSSSVKAESVEDIEREEGLGPQPMIKDSTNNTMSPPLPPALSYIRKLATIPSLRKSSQ